MDMNNQQPIQQPMQMQQPQPVQAGFMQNQYHQQREQIPFLEMDADRTYTLIMDYKNPGKRTKGRWEGYYYVFREAISGQKFGFVARRTLHGNFSMFVNKGDQFTLSKFVVGMGAEGRPRYGYLLNGQSLKTISMPAPPPQPYGYPQQYQQYPQFGYPQQPPMPAPMQQQQFQMPTPPVSIPGSIPVPNQQLPLTRSLDEKEQKLVDTFRKAGLVGMAKKDLIIRGAKDNGFDDKRALEIYSNYLST